MIRNVCTTLLICAALVTWSPSIQAAEGIGSWVQVSLGLNGMAMDDINETEFRWHDESPDGFDLDDLTSGMALSFGIGYDLTPALGYGLFWEHQYASTSGTDVDMKADVNLSAEIFAGRVTYKFIRTEKWSLGLAGSLGYLIAAGDVKKTTSGANYGKTDISGHCWALEGMADLEFVVGEKTRVQITGGWRQAEVGSFEYGGGDATGPDGQDMSLDYTGFTARVGLKYRFGNVVKQVTPNIY